MGGIGIWLTGQQSIQMVKHQDVVAGIWGQSMCGEREGALDCKYLKVYVRSMILLSPLLLSRTE